MTDLHGTVLAHAAARIGRGGGLVPLCRGRERKEGRGRVRGEGKGREDEEGEDMGERGREEEGRTSREEREKGEATWGREGWEERKRRHHHWK